MSWWSKTKHFFHFSKPRSFNIKRDSCWIKTEPYEDGCCAVIKILARKKSKCNLCPIQDLKYIIYYSNGESRTKYIPFVDFADALKNGFFKGLPDYKFNVLVAAWSNRSNE